MSELENKMDKIGAVDLLTLTQWTNELIEQHEDAKLSAWRIRMPGTKYNAGDKVIIPGVSNFDKILRCEAAGVTSEEAFPADYDELGVGDVVNDGTVEWGVVNLVTIPDIEDAPVTSVNGKTGDVNLTASNVGASPTGHKHEISDTNNLGTRLDALFPKTGGTVTGEIRRKLANITIGAVPANAEYNGAIVFSDKNNNIVGAIQFAQYAGNNDILMRIYTVNADGSEGEKIVLAPGYVDLPATVRLTNGIIKTKSVTERLAIYGGTASNNGAYLVLRGKDNSAGGHTPGEFVVATCEIDNETNVLRGGSDGKLTWKNKDITLGYPNYSAGVSLGNVSSYTATADGWIFATGRREDKYWNLRVGGARVFETGGSSWDAGSCLIPIKKGDVVKTYNGRDEATTAFAVDMVFYPNR